VWLDVQPRQAPEEGRRGLPVEAVFTVRAEVGWVVVDGLRKCYARATHSEVTERQEAGDKK